MRHPQRRIPCADSISRELAQMSRRLAQLEEELERSRRLAELGTLTGAIAHEINNILTPVLSYAHLALADPDDAALARKALYRAADGTQRASAIATAILGLLRTAPSTPTAAPSCGLADAVDAALSGLAVRPEDHAIDVRIDIPSTLRAAISPIALEQVVLNLALNAIEAMRRRTNASGGGTHHAVLEITAECSTWNTPDAQPDAVVLRVADNGPGVPPHLAEALFQPLVRADNHPAAKGVGLGLAISRQLIETAGGRLTLDNRPGEGATFLIHLPTPATPAGVSHAGSTAPAE